MGEVLSILPHSMIEKGYSKEHRSVDLKNGSQILFVTNEQGWQAMRGKQFDIFAPDEENILPRLYPALPG